MHPATAPARVLALMCCLMAAAAGEPASAPAAATLRLKAGDVLHIVGDSVTTGSNQPFGFTSLVRRAWEEQRADQPVTIGATGYWGSPSDALRQAVPKLLAAKTKPTHVLIYFGLNDSKSSTVQSQESYAGNLRTAVAALRQAGVVPALCTPTVWRSMKQTIPYAEVARRVAAEDGTAVLDLHAAFDRYLRSVATFPAGEPAHVGGLSTLLDPTCDGVHLGAVGNRLIAAEILQALGLQAVWKRHAVVVSIGNPDRNIGYPPRAKGAITMEPKKDLYELGERITLRVEPEEGAKFLRWRGSVEGEQPTVTCTVDGSAFIEAVVEPPAGRRR